MDHGREAGRAERVGVAGRIKERITLNPMISVLAVGAFVRVVSLYYGDFNTVSKWSAYGLPLTRRTFDRICPRDSPVSLR